MVVVILLTVLALLLPLVILWPFSRGQKALVLMVIVLHLIGMFLLHYRLVHTTGLPIVIDVHDDEQKYYDNTAHFANQPPFSVTRSAAIDAAQGSRHFGYEFVLGTLWTITSNPMLAMRLLKTLLFFTSLSCLIRVWRTAYGSGLAMGGFAFMAIVCTPVFYYNYRNLKDSLILALFMFIMALLDTLLRPRKDQLRPRSTGKTALGWFVLLILLYTISIFRLYVAAAIVISLMMHAIATTPRIGIKGRVALLAASIIVVLFALSTGIVAAMKEMSGGEIPLGTPTLLGILQAFLSPVPWGVLVQAEPFNVPFYSIYWLLLPYVLYVFFRHLWGNINWRLFMYIMITYAVGAPIGDPPRKRLIVYPILVTWLLAHLAYKRWVRAGQAEYEAEVDQNDGQKYEDYVPVGSGEEIGLNVNSGR